ncbi:MAG: sigma-70 family RNA polymerase sigma factor [Propionibacteriaceae bacterium]|jgi:RNA polymerase sigma factor (sigma-70 family)|nr:sigma-70 family RNA polymerase sigma factor [Propionibacteriaceae bacterium]
MENYPRLTETEEQRLAKQMEAGTLAAAMLDPDDPSQPAAPPDELAALVRQGDRAREQLIFAHLGLARHIASDLARRTQVPAEDLYQEGCLAVGRAVLRYDYRQGPLAPYVGACVRHTMRQLAYRRDHPEPDSEYVDAILHNVTRQPEDEDEAQTRQVIDQGLRRLPAEEGRIVRLRLGWDDGHPLTQAVLARRFVMSVPKVRRLERRGLAELRRYWLREMVG